MRHADEQESVLGPIPTIFMFSGQGSQYYQMGWELYQAEPVFRATVERLDAEVERELGKSVVARIYDARRLKSEPFYETVFTHPAIVMIELALAEMLIAEGLVPDYLLGASLGEFAAAAIAGVIAPEACVRVVVKQARVFDAYCRRGGMLAILASPGLYDKTPLLRDETHIASRNYAGHFVVAGRDEALAAVEDLLRTKDVLFERVPVKHGFHSRLMDAAKAACRALLDGVELHRPRIPLISCADEGPLEAATAEHFWSVVREPIEFAGTIAALETKGAYLYLDLGPSGTLHNFVRNNLAATSRSRSFPLLSPFGNNTQLLAKVRAHYEGGIRNRRTGR